MRITLFDILLLLGMVGGAAWGFYRGLFRSAVGTLVIYVATVVATAGYRSMSRLVISVTGAGGAAADVAAFLLVMGVLIFLFDLVGKDLVSYLDTSRMGVWVNLGGIVFGFVNAAIICAVILIVIRSISGGEKWFGYQGVQEFLRNQTYGSWMAYVFSPFMRFLLAVIKPWLFGHDLPPLLVNAF